MDLRFLKSSLGSPQKMRPKPYGCAKRIEKPLKDKLLLQGPNRGFFAAEGPHFYTSIFRGIQKKEGDAEMKD